MGIRHRLAAAYLPAAMETRALRRAPQPRATVLMYHEVLPDALEVPSWLVVRKSFFTCQMQYLKKHYEVLSLDAAIERLLDQDDASSNRPPIAVITFDDGYAGNLVHAVPILKEHKFPFTVYVATSRIARGGRFWYDDVICALIATGSRSIETSKGIVRYSRSSRSEAGRWAEIDRVLSSLKALPADERRSIADALADRVYVPELRMMTPQEVRKLCEEPLATIGNHTHGHDLLDQVCRVDAKKSIERAQALLEEWTGKTPRHFSYPNGNYTTEVTDLVERLGLSTAVTTVRRPWCATDHRYEIPRIGIGRFDNLNLFRARACGLVS